MFAMLNRKSNAMRKLFVAVVAAVVMSSCSTTQNLDSGRMANAGTAAVSALMITDAQIASLCQQYMVESDQENTVLPANDAYSQRLASVMSRFKNLGDLNVNYAVYQSSTVNAFASGDGSIRVYSGLMDVMTDDELFAVIGHELGHLKNNDVRDAYRTAYITVAAREGLAAINPNMAWITDGLVGSIGQELATSAYSRKQEYEADEAAFQFCVTNGVDPYAMYNALQVLIRLSGNSGTSSKVAQMFSTHPDSEKRAKRIKDMAQALGATNTKTSSSSASVKPTAKPSAQPTSTTTTSGNNKVNIKKP